MKTEESAVQSEELAALGMLIAGIAHDLNNPNNFISFNIPILRDYLEEIMPVVDRHAQNTTGYEVLGMPYGEFRTDLFRLLENVEHGTRRIKSIVTDLRDFVSKRDPGEQQEVNLREIIFKGIALCESDLKQKVKTLAVNVPDELPHILSRPQSLELVLINLLVNALEAMDKDDSWIRVRAFSSREGEKGCVVMEVSDNGCGMDETTRARLFHPLFYPQAAQGRHGSGSLHLPQPRGRYGRTDRH